MLFWYGLCFIKLSHAAHTNFYRSAAAGRAIAIAIAIAIPLPFAIAIAFGVTVGVTTIANTDTYTGHGSWDGWTEAAHEMWKVEHLPG